MGNSFSYSDIKKKESKEDIELEELKKKYYSNMFLCFKGGLVKVSSR